MLQQLFLFNIIPHQAEELVQDPVYWQILIKELQTNLFPKFIENLQ